MGFSVVEAMKAWCMRRNLGELRRDLDVARAGFFFAGAVLGDFFLVVELEAEAAGVEPRVCAATVAARTNAPSSNAKQKNLRNPTTSF
jgi:hypothetical protein